MPIHKQIPLLKDHHTHPFMFALLSHCINLSATKTKEEALSMMKKDKANINVILGWNNSWYSFQTEELESLPPVLICNASFHRFLINRVATEKLRDADKAILSHFKDERWVEKNLHNIQKVILNLCPYAPEQIEHFYHYLLQQGIWYAEEMLLPNEAVIHLHKELGYLERTRFWTDIETFQDLSEPAQQLVYGIKIFVDGALGCETAALNTPYLTTDKQGLLVYSDKELYRLIREVILLHKAMAFHAIGDIATAQIISVITQINHECGKIPPTRIEHSQFISPNDAKTAKQLGIILSMQPNFSFDSIQYQDRLSIEYCRKNNPFRMLIDEIGFVPGQNLLFGSDGMPHGVPNALESALFPPFPEQALTLDEFVAGYCMPDKKHGYIEVIIDEKTQTVSTTVKV